MYDCKTSHSKPFYCIIFWVTSPVPHALVRVTRWYSGGVWSCLKSPSSSTQMLGILARWLKSLSFSVTLRVFLYSLISRVAEFLTWCLRTLASVPREQKGSCGVSYDQASGDPRYYLHCHLFVNKSLKLV